MGFQILKWSHPPLKSILPNPFSIAVSLEAEGTIRPVCGTRRVPSLLNKLNRAAVALCLVITLLVALTVCTGILIAALKYAANRANQTFLRDALSPHGAIYSQLAVRPAVEEEK